MSASMSAIQSVLIEPSTVLATKGQSVLVDISSVTSRVFLLTLTIREVVEQEYIELSVYGSADGAQFGTTPIATLPQRFYPGEYPTLLDFSSRPDVNFVRINWDCARWGRGALNPRFVCGLTLREVPTELLSEAKQYAR